MGFFDFAVLPNDVVSAVCPMLQATAQEPDSGLWVPRMCYRAVERVLKLQLSTSKAGQQV